mmetsp:Transcript_27933/g.43385  ORF Transcript_27933/g.43385 Transcript_27933/m.43385 type:complete len:386 (+) Transcript_27933:284-1441(+)|eukprot:CAMPEP_0196814882 /NCGR_PEP_ID=MMETSP1362-20130617/46330_1 /TAXON_ID=163516 /ORGANISM="Leptocylindrus danicus, Strain CCMP1856" /LENGTH=385 /DNA_ID=CAMNT_0042191647 /DNA_START=255 /DNA_END=1412 /DNA_ORIENTATION=+
MGGLLTDPSTVGVYGVSLTGTLFLIATWRLTAHLFGYCTGCGGTSGGGGRAEGLTMRRSFHSLLWIAMLFEMLGYAEMLGFRLSEDKNKSEKWGYCLLEVLGRCTFEFGAFSVATVLWFFTVKSSRAGQGVGTGTNEEHFQNFGKLYFLPFLVLLVFFALTTHSIFVAVDLVQGDDETLHDWKYNSSEHQRHLVAEGCWWAIHGVMVLTCGWLMYLRLLGLPSYRSLRASQKTPILTRMLVTLFSCAACYEMRAVMIFLARTSLDDDDPDAEDFENGHVWWICAMWVPTLVPSTLLLYAFRRLERRPSWIEGVPESTASAIPSPSPPDEIWKSFKRIIYDSNGEEDYSDDSSFDYTSYRSDDDFDDGIDTLLTPLQDPRHNESFS